MSTTTERPWYHSKAFVYSLCTLLALLWIPCFVIIFISGRRLWKLWSVKRRFDQQMKRKEKLLHQHWHVYFRDLEQERITDPGTWAFEPLVHLSLEERGALGFEKLKRETARMIAVDSKTGRGSSEIERVVIFDYIQEISDEKTEKWGEKSGLIRPLPGCRNEKIKIRRDSQVFLREEQRKPVNVEPPPKAKGERPEATFSEDCLHMTELYDYYGYSVYLCQAPLPKEFSPHWRAIWQERIGVIVWIGALVELGRPKLDPYIAMKKGGTMICEQLTIKTTAIYKVENDYDTYSLTVVNAAERYEKLSTRSLFLFHVHAWPDHKQPHNPAGLANLLVQIQGRQLVATKESNLSGLLVHCSLGVQRSPALVAAYIGRQMWMATRRVNLMGIFQYIRQYRFKSFGMGNPFSQVQIVSGVLQVIAARAAKDEVVQRPHMTAEERAVFDRKRRLAEMSKQLLEGKMDESERKELAGPAAVV